MIVGDAELLRVVEMPPHHTGLLRDTMNALPLVPMFTEYICP